MGKITKTFVVGATLGAIAALLLAPKPGKQTRKILQDKYEEISKEVMKQSAKIKKLTIREYKNLVDKAMKMAEKGAATKEDVLALRAHLMEQWKMLEKKLKK